MVGQWHDGRPYGSESVVRDNWLWLNISTGDIGPPWRDMPAICCCRFDTLEIIAVQMNPSITGLGQGVMECLGVEVQI